MAGIADVSTIDVVGQDADGTYLVVMVEERLWGADPEQSAQLRTKLGVYAGFILDGSLARTYPETAGERVDIQLDCVEELPEEITTVIARARAWLGGAGIGVRVNVRR